MGTLCLNCRRLINRGDYCSSTCRSACHRLRARLAELHPSIGWFHELTRKYAPSAATGYRLVRHVLSDRWIYPRGNRKGWLSVDHGLAYRAAFRLYPWEIPSVDTPAIYGVCFVRRGQVLGTSEALLAGVWLVPVLPMPSPGSRF